MKLRTSYFNDGVLRKNITRYAPLWGTYLVMGLLISIFLGIAAREFDYEQASVDYAAILGEVIPAMSCINMAYAALSALLLFQDLHVTRMCYSLHAMPMRREGWFLTHVVTGLLFSLVPNLLVTVVMLINSGRHFYMPLIWLLACTVQFVAYFGVAVFSMHITGQKGAAVSIYALILLLPYLLCGLTELYFGRFWNGVVISMEPFEKFSLVRHLFQMRVDPGSSDGFYNGLYVLQPKFIGFGQGFICAAFGILLMILALLIYRRRHLESAGDFITLQPAAPVVLVLFAVSVGGALWAIFNFNFLVLLLGLALGFFGGRMALQRTVKVLSKRNILGCGILWGTVLLSIGLAVLDPMGITRWVPEPTQIISAQVSTYALYVGATLDSTEDLETVQKLHTWAVEHPYEDPYDSFFVNYSRSDMETFHVTYHMKNGTTRERNYEIPVDSEGGQLLKNIHSQPEYLFGGYASTAEELIRVTKELQMDGDLLANGITEDKEDAEPIYLDPEQRSGLIRAMEQDWLAGNLAQSWVFHTDEEYLCRLTLLVQSDERKSTYLDLRIYPSATHTVQWLQVNGFLPAELPAQ